MQTDAAAEPPVISSSARSWINLLVVAASVVVLASILLPMALQARDAARRVHSKNNLKQIGLALHNYHDVYNTLPIGWDTDSEGKTKHGVWTRIIPFLFSSPVYSWVDFDFEWDHPTNEWIFRDASIHLENPAASQTETSDGFTQAHYAFNQDLIHQNNGLGFRDLSGSLNQICLAAEIGDQYVPWGYPFQSRDPRVTLNSAPESFGRPTGGGALLGMADGSVKWLPNNADITFNTDLPVAESKVRSPPYPERFGVQGNFESIRILSFSKGEPEPITTEMVQAAIKQTPNAQSFIAPDWSPSESDIDMLKSLKRLHYLVIADPESQATMNSLIAFKQFETIVCNRKVVRDQQK